MTDPVSASEWQEAVDWAGGLLAVKSARIYGLVTGGPGIDVGRCEDILARGAKLGYVPRAGADEAVAVELANPPAGFCARHCDVLPTPSGH